MHDWTNFNIDQSKQYVLGHLSMQPQKIISTSGPTISNLPSKRIRLRTQCVDQLLNAGAIDQTQYDKLKETILSDIKKCDKVMQLATLWCDNKILSLLWLYYKNLLVSWPWRQLFYTTDTVQYNEPALAP